MPLITLTLFESASGHLRRRITVKRAIILVSCIAATAVFAHLSTEMKCYYPSEMELRRMICNHLDDLTERERTILESFYPPPPPMGTHEDVIRCIEPRKKCAANWQHWGDVLSGRPLGSSGEIQQGWTGMSRIP
ncbi:hypothetical protein CENSYa_1248 [Cenarchaeum symbiosum A]|uniref:Uncharacterized protein n=1 Tax=Cenarchaeum symbiosum (strain A) TaxID=414004 RepID=A0RX04_CENSY|nr:hypothetical protein CENSYa_1248 [Cenarchaeum symbiosum A]